MKIRFLHPADARLSFQPGDEVTVKTLTPQLQSLLKSRRIDNRPVCEVVREADETHDPLAKDEHAVTGAGGSRRGGGAR